MSFVGTTASWHGGTSSHAKSTLLLTRRPTFGCMSWSRRHANGIAKRLFVRVGKQRQHEERRCDWRFRTASVRIRPTELKPRSTAFLFACLPHSISGRPEEAGTRFEETEKREKDQSRCRAKQRPCDNAALGCNMHEKGILVCDGVQTKNERGHFGTDAGCQRLSWDLKRTTWSREINGRSQQHLDAEPTSIRHGDPIKIRACAGSRGWVQREQWSEGTASRRGEGSAVVLLTCNVGCRADGDARGVSCRVSKTVPKHTLACLNAVPVPLRRLLLVLGALCSS